MIRSLSQDGQLPPTAMDHFSAQSLSRSSDDFNDNGRPESAQKDHDFLSFLSLVVSVVRGMSTDLFLSSVVLGPALNIQDPADRGTFFSITLIEEKELSQNMVVSPNHLNPLPQIVALKMPLLEGDAGRPRDRRAFTSMATELQILRDDYIYDHENVVTLLGVLWQVDAGGRLLPAFAMEGSDIGNLRVFLSNNNIGLAERVGICIDIASAVKAIHSRGVVHCDIKPKNVLVFKRDFNSVVAKICDFGSSILVANDEPNCEIRGGTKAWQAPEVDETLGAEQLRKADVYSFGLVFWYVFSPDAVDAILDCDATSLHESKVSGDLLDTALETLEAQCESAPQSINTDVLQMQQCILGSTLACSPSERWDMDAILNALFEIADCMTTAGEMFSSSSATSAVLNDRVARERMRLAEAKVGSYIQDRQSDDGILHVRAFPTPSIFTHAADCM